MDFRRSEINSKQELQEEDNEERMNARKDKVVKKKERERELQISRGHYQTCKPSP